MKEDDRGSARYEGDEPVKRRTIPVNLATLPSPRRCGDDQQPSPRTGLHLELSLAAVLVTCPLSQPHDGSSPTYMF